MNELNNRSIVFFRESQGFEIRNRYKNPSKLRGNSETPEDITSFLKDYPSGCKSATK